MSLSIKEGALVHLAFDLKSLYGRSMEGIGGPPYAKPAPNLNTVPVLQQIWDRLMQMITDDLQIAWNCPCERSALKDLGISGSRRLS